MDLDAWVKHYGELRSWSFRQPLEPFPSFRNRCVAAAWDYVERYSLHQLRRGITIPPRIHHFRAIDRGWDEPTGMIHLIVPDRELQAEAKVFQLGFSLDPQEHCRQLEGGHFSRLEVFQQWPGSRRLAGALAESLLPMQGRDGWYRWEQDEVMAWAMAMDVVSNAWAHRRYWFGLGDPG